MRTWIPLVVGLLGCGSSSTSGGGGDAAGADGTTATKTGAITIQSYTAMQPPGTTVQGGGASASFLASNGPCSRSMTGMCEIDNCGNGSPAIVSAGVVTISGAAMPIMMTPAGDRSYMMLMTTTPLFAGGETLTFAAAGADVPAFTQTVTAPGKVTITSPVKPATSLAIDRTMDFTVSWTGGSGTVQLALVHGGQSGFSLFCRFPASAGTGTIPASTLAMLGQGTGAFAFASLGRTIDDSAAWGVVLEAYYNAVWSDDSIVSGPTAVN